MHPDLFSHRRDGPCHASALKKHPPGSLLYRSTRSDRSSSQQPHPTELFPQPSHVLLEPLQPAAEDHLHGKGHHLCPRTTLHYVLGCTNPLEQQQLLLPADDPSADSKSHHSHRQHADRVDQYERHPSFQQLTASLPADLGSDECRLG